MVFASFVFLFGFLPALLLVHQLTPRRYHNVVLLIFSYVFYGWWRADFCLLLLVTSAVDYTVGRGISSTDDPSRRRLWLGVSIIANLGLLCYFKYANFGIETFNQLVRAFGGKPVAWSAVVLPVGISFITFQTMSYTIDVYRRDVEPSRSPLEFLTYVSLFPQLVAGPIVRYKIVADELANRTQTREQFAFGTMMFMIGFSKKVLFANNFGLMADEAFESAAPGLFGAWLGISAYTLQIYFDFSGYSDMAVGLGAMLGFRFPSNFERPYLSRSITEFWRRWHITLSTWIRDYLYISMGGSRGSKFATYRNLAVSMLLCGLWHGANWTYILWGAFHGLWLIVERLSQKKTLFDRVSSPVQTLLTLLIVAVGWVLFRAETLTDAGRYLRAMGNLRSVGFASDAHWLAHPALVTLSALGWAAIFCTRPASSQAASRTPLLIAGHFTLFLVAVEELLSQGFSPFLYFQF